MTQPVGRPSLYKPELGALVCERVATHRHGLKKICAMYEDMPDHSTIMLWRIKHREFSDQYAQAKRYQMDLILEELDAAMDESLQYYIDEKGNTRIDSPSATIAIAKANNAKWYASKLAPKLYGDVKTDDNNPSETLSKIQALVADINKTNISDV